MRFVIVVHTSKRKNMKMKTFTLTLGALLTSMSLNAQTARVQAIHNCPDPAAATVDVWINNSLLLPNFNFQDASPFIDAPTNMNFDLSICLPGQSDTTGAILTKTFNLPANSVSVVVASGGLSETGSSAFDLRAYVGQEEAANQGAGEVSVNVIHGAYDAPMVDIYESQVLADELVPDLSFGDDIGAYADLPAADFDLQVRTQSMVVAAQFDGDLSSLADSAVVVMATGYLDPSAAVGTEPFGLMAVLPNGTVLPLMSQAITPARLQVIHNCAATDAASVDVWLNDGPMPLIDDFMFRTASPFINAPAGEFFDVSVALPTSTDTTGALFKKEFILESSKTYIVVASGTVGSGTYSPATAFDLVVIPDARETSSDPAEVDVMVFHGATDAPVVDVLETQVGAGTLVDDLAYGMSDGYLELTPADYDLGVADMTGATTLFSYDADLSALGGSAITVLASGFVDPSMNNMGSPFGLWVATPAGGPLLELSNITGVEDNAFDKLTAYPVPADDQLTLTFDSNIAGTLTIKMYSTDGRLVYNSNQQMQVGANQFDVDLNQPEAGLYTLSISNETSQQSIQIMVK